MTRDDDDTDYTWVDPDTTAATNPAIGGPRDALVTLSVGEVLSDRYEVRAFVGEGGMGAVYLAFDRVLGDEVALKVVRADQARRGGDDLRDEVRLAQRVTHRNVCRTYDLEMIGERHVVKMEYVRGESLASVLAKQPRQSIARAVAIGRAITDGLYAAHAVGVVHRDLKPGNVMLGAGDRVVLMDFGLAQWATAGGDDRSDYAGTPGYMSPEQMAGTAIDTRSDLYALGCVMYEMLAGERLLATGSFEDVWRRQRAMTEPPDVRAKRPEVPRWVARAVRLLVSRDPQARRAGVRLLARGGRDPWLYLASAVVLVAGGVMAFVLHARFGGTAGPWVPHVVPVLPQFLENADDPLISPGDRWISYMSDRGHAGVFAVFVQPREGGESHQISAAGQDCVRPQWTYTGDGVMMACGTHEHYRITRQPIDVATGTPRGAPEPVGEGRNAAACGPHAIATIAPDARSIAVRDTSTERASEIRDEAGELWAMQCSRDGSTIAYIDADDVWVAGLAPVVPARKVAKSTRTSGVGIAPGGGSVVFVRERGAALTEFVEVTLADGAVHPISAGDDHPYSPSMSADGRYLVFDRDVTSRPPFLLDARGERTQLSVTLDVFDTPSPSPVAGVPELVALAREDDKVVVIQGDGSAMRVIGDGAHPFFDATGARVLFREAKEHTHLMAAPAAGGGPSTLVAALPGEIVDGMGAADGAHVELVRDAGVHEGWRVRADGTFEREERAGGLVVPAPNGGWRAVLFDTSGDLGVRLVPPGAALDRGEHFARMPGLPRWLDDRRFAYCDHAACHVRDVVAGTATSEPHPDFADVLSVGAGGDHWYTAEYVGQVTRHVITNWATRPWAPR